MIIQNSKIIYPFTNQIYDGSYAISQAQKKVATSIKYIHLDLLSTTSIYNDLEYINVYLNQLDQNLIKFKIQCTYKHKRTLCQQITVPYVRQDNIGYSTASEIESDVTSSIFQVIPDRPVILFNQDINFNQIKVLKNLRLRLAAQCLNISLKGATISRIRWSDLNAYNNQNTYFNSYDGPLELSSGYNCQVRYNDGVLSIAAAKNLGEGSVYLQDTNVAQQIIAKSVPGIKYINSFSKNITFTSSPSITISQTIDTDTLKLDIFMR